MARDWLGVGRAAPRLDGPDAVGPYHNEFGDFIHNRSEVPF